MTELLDRHLEQLAWRLGSFLRGFDDPTVHVGSRRQFAREVQKLLELPLVHDPESGGAISYVQAIDRLRTPEHLEQVATPVDVLLRGLGGPATTAIKPRLLVPQEQLVPDLRAVLRAPKLCFDFGVSDRERFIAVANAIVARENLSGVVLRLLPMVPAVSSVVPYDLLRELVALDGVQTYQEEGTIVALSPDGDGTK